MMAYKRSVGKAVQEKYLCLVDAVRFGGHVDVSWEDTSAYWEMDAEDWCMVEDGDWYMLGE